MSKAISTPEAQTGQLFAAIILYVEARLPLSLCLRTDCLIPSCTLTEKGAAGKKELPLTLIDDMMDLTAQKGNKRM